MLDNWEDLNNVANLEGQSIVRLQILLGDLYLLLDYLLLARLGFLLLTVHLLLQLLSQLVLKNGSVVV